MARRKVKSSSLQKRGNGKKRDGNNNNNAAVVAVGIDLGTTNSCVAVWLESDGRAKVIKARVDEETKSRTSPSTAGVSVMGTFSPKWRVSSVGHGAYREADSISEVRTIRGAKHVIGRTYEECAGARIPVNFSISKGTKFRRGESSVVVSPLGGGESVRGLSPEEISSALLVGLKTRAEIYLGKKVTHAVIGVPAYFNASQRAATKAAAEMAGMEVLRLLSEPMAAATAYGLAVAGSKTVCVVDFGGGTFDVSVLSVDKGEFKALAIGGCNDLGGDNLDDALARFCADDWGIDISEGEMEALRHSCEAAKCQLSSQDVATISLTARDGKSFHREITLGEFDSVVSPSIDRCVKIVKEVVLDAEKSIDEVVLVGGSTQLPLLRKRLQKEFPAIELCKSIRSDCTVAEGAAIRAAMMTGADEYRMKKVLMLDALPFSVGLEDSEGNFEALIRRNSRLPVSSTRRFATCQDGQRGISVDVFEGEHRVAAENKWLGYHNFMIPRGSRYRAGERSMDVTFSVDANGILSVRAVVPDDETILSEHGDDGGADGPSTVALALYLVVLAVLYAVAKTLFPSTVNESLVN